MKKRTVSKLLAVFIAIMMAATIAMMAACNGDTTVPPGGDVVAVTGITIDAPNNTPFSMVQAASRPMAATIAPANATDQGVTWSSSNPLVAAFVGNVLTAVAPGDAVLTVRANAAPLVHYATVAVTVTPATPPPPTVNVTGITVTPNVVPLGVGDTFNANVLNIAIAPANASNQNVTFHAMNGYVSVAGSIVTGVAAGTGIVQVRSVSNPTVVADITVNVVAESIPVTGITVTESTLNLTNGAARSVGFAFVPADTTQRNVNLALSEPGVVNAAISGNNVVINAVGVGTTVLTLTPQAGTAATITITVVPRPAGAIATVAEFNAITETTGWQTMNWFLQNDIDFAGGALTPIGPVGAAGATPSPTGANTFRGIFDGRGFALRNFTLATPEWHIGIFRNVYGALIRNLTIEGGIVSSVVPGLGYPDSNVPSLGGVLAGRVAGATIIENILITDTTLEGGRGFMHYQNGALAGVIYPGAILRNIVLDVVGLSEIRSLSTDLYAHTVSNVFIVDNGSAFVVGRTPGPYTPDTTQTTVAGVISITGTTDFAPLGTTYWDIPAFGQPTTRQLAGLPNFRELYSTITNTATGDGFTVGAPARAWNNGLSVSITVTREVGYEGTPTLTINGDTVPHTSVEGTAFTFVVAVTEDINITAVNGITAIAGLGFYEGIEGWRGIRNVNEFNLMLAGERAGNYFLMNNIDFEGQDSHSVVGWQTPAQAFSGVFDGRGFAIQNVRIVTSEALGHGGLFPRLTGTVRNVAITGFTTNATGGQSGIVTPNLDGGTIENVFLSGTSSFAGVAWGVWGRAGFVAGITEPGDWIIRNVVMDVTRTTAYTLDITSAVRTGGSMSNIFARIAGPAAAAFSDGSFATVYFAGPTAIVDGVTDFAPLGTTYWNTAGATPVLVQLGNPAPIVTP